LTADSPQQLTEQNCFRKTYHSLAYWRVYYHIQLAYQRQNTEQSVHCDNYHSTVTDRQTDGQTQRHSWEQYLTTSVQ